MLFRSYTGISTQIQRANYTVTNVTANPTATYDGLAHAMYTGTPTIKTLSGLSTDFIDTRYKLIYTANNGTQTTTLSTNPDADLRNVTHAGTYTLYVTWTAAEGTHRNQIIPNPDGIEVLSFEIAKATTPDRISVENLIYDTRNTIGTDGYSRPFANTTAVDLTVYDQDTYNGITTHNENLYNQLSMAFVRADNIPEDGDLTSLPFTKCLTPDEFNLALRNAAADSYGVWHLYFRIDRHNSLVDDIIFYVTEVVVLQYEATTNDLTGLTILDSLPKVCQ